MAESVDASDLKSDKPKGLCGFNSRSEYGKAAVGLTIDSRFSSTRCLAWEPTPATRTAQYSSGRSYKPTSRIKRSPPVRSGNKFFRSNDTEARQKARSISGDSTRKERNAPRMV